MLNATDNPVEWVLFMDELDEAKEHLEKLTKDLSQAGRFDESEFAIYLGHIYAHLNRAWHRRNLTTAITDEEWNAFRRFPQDIEPIA